MIDQLLTDVKAAQDNQILSLRRFQSAYEQQEAVWQKLEPLPSDSGEARNTVRELLHGNQQLEAQADALEQENRKAEDILQKIRDEAKISRLTAQQQADFAAREAEQIQLEKDMMQKEQNFNALQGSWQAKQAEVNEAAGYLPGGLSRRIWDYCAMGLRLKETDGGDYFRVVGAGDRNPYTGQRMLSDRQLREVILRLVKEQNATMIYCYKGNEIDQQLTQRAQKMLMDMMQPGHILEGFQVNVSRVRMGKGELEPWRWNLFGLSQYFHDRAVDRDAEAAAKADKKDLKAEGRYPWSLRT